MEDICIEIVSGLGIKPCSNQAPSKADVANSLKMAGRVNYKKLLKPKVDGEGGVRLDNGKRFKPYAMNLQVQINDIKRPSTIAQVLVDEKLMEGEFTTTNGSKYHDVIARAVGDALRRSIGTKHTFIVKLA